MCLFHVGQYSLVLGSQTSHQKHPLPGEVAELMLSHLDRESLRHGIAVNRSWKALTLSMLDGKAHGYVLGIQEVLRDIDLKKTLSIPRLQKLEGLQQVLRHSNAIQCALFSDLSAISMEMLQKLQKELKRSIKHFTLGDVIGESLIQKELNALLAQSSEEGREKLHAYLIERIHDGNPRCAIDLFERDHEEAPLYFQEICQTLIEQGHAEKALHLIRTTRKEEVTLQMALPPIAKKLKESGHPLQAEETLSMITYTFRLRRC